MAYLKKDETHTSTLTLEFASGWPAGTWLWNTFFEPINGLKTHVFRRHDLLELGERELLVVLGQVVAEHLLQVLQVLLAQVRPLPEGKEGHG